MVGDKNLIASAGRRNAACGLVAEEGAEMLQALGKPGVAGLDGLGANRIIRHLSRRQEWRSQTRSSGASIPPSAGLVGYSTSVP